MPLPHYLPAHMFCSAVFIMHFEQRAILGLGLMRRGEGVGWTQWAEEWGKGQNWVNRNKSTPPLTNYNKYNISVHYQNLKKKINGAKRNRKIIRNNPLTDSLFLVSLKKILFDFRVNCLLCILTSFRVLCTPESWLKYPLGCFQPFDYI